MANIAERASYDSIKLMKAAALCGSVDLVCAFAAYIEPQMAERTFQFQSEPTGDDHPQHHHLADAITSSAFEQIAEDSMRFISTVAIGSLIAAAPCLLGAQSTGQAHDAKTPQPAGEMQTLITALTGHWSLKLKFEPSKETPRGLEGTGEESWHAGPGGLTFTDEEVFSAGPQKMVVVGILWRDAKTREFHAMDCSNEIPNTCDLKGALDDVVVHWTGSELTIDEKELSQGKMMTSRVAWSDITSNSFTETGYLAPPGGPFQKVMTIYATRAGAK